MSIFGLPLSWVPLPVGRISAEGVTTRLVDDVCGNIAKVRIGHRILALPVLLANGCDLDIVGGCSDEGAITAPSSMRATACWIFEAWSGLMSAQATTARPRPAPMAALLFGSGRSAMVTKASAAATSVPASERTLEPASGRHALGRQKRCRSLEEALHVSGRGQFSARQAGCAGGHCRTHATAWITAAAPIILMIRRLLIVRSYIAVHKLDPES